MGIGMLMKVCNPSFEEKEPNKCLIIECVNKKHALFSTGQNYMHILFISDNFPQRLMRLRQERLSIALNGLS